MHTSYVNGKYHWPKTLSAALNFIFNYKWRKRHPVHKYEYREGVALKVKVNPGGFSVDCYNCGMSGHMARDCPETRKEEGGNY